MKNDLVCQLNFDHKIWAEGGTPNSFSRPGQDGVMSYLLDSPRKKDLLIPVGQYYFETHNKPAAKVFSPHPSKVRIQMFQFNVYLESSDQVEDKRS